MGRVGSEDYGIQCILMGCELGLRDVEEVSRLARVAVSTVCRGRLSLRGTGVIRTRLRKSVQVCIASFRGAPAGRTSQLKSWKADTKSWLMMSWLKWANEFSR